MLAKERGLGCQRTSPKLNKSVYCCQPAHHMTNVKERGLGVPMGQPKIKQIWWRKWANILWVCYGPSNAIRGLDFFVIGCKIIKLNLALDLINIFFGPWGAMDTHTLQVAPPLASNLISIPRIRTLHLKYGCKFKSWKLIPNPQTL